MTQAECSGTQPRANGVNTLAFRMCQNNTFYKIDADCVGLMEKNIDWRLNRQWLDLLARSGSPLFVSMQPSQITDAIADDLKKRLKYPRVRRMLQNLWTGFITTLRSCGKLTVKLLFTTLLWTITRCLPRKFMQHSHHRLCFNAPAVTE